MRLPSFLRLKAASDELMRIDLLRFVASAGIVLYHVSTIFAGAPAWLPASIHGLHLLVDLFFAISGMIIAMVYADRLSSPSDYGQFLVRRLARIGPLHWATLFLLLAMGGVMASLHVAANDPGRYDMRCLAPQVLMIHAFNVCSHRSFNIVSWSISAEMAMYVAFPLFALIARPLRKATVVVAVAIAAILMMVDPGWTDRTFDFGALRAVPSFLFGIGLYQLREDLRRLPAMSAVSTILGVAFFAGCAVAAPSDILLPIAWVWVAATYAADLAKKPGPVARLLGPLGQLTYSIYMLHTIVMTIGIAIIGTRILHLHGMPLNLWIAFVFFVPFPLLAAASLHYFEDPARRWMSKLGGARARPPRTPSGGHGDQAVTDGAGASPEAP